MTQELLELAREVLQIESEAIAQLVARLDDKFERAVALVVECRGRVVVTGVGKSGHIARKIAATLASTGTPALFLHAGEGLHGDLGMIASDDVLVAISYSGRSAELTGILPAVRALGVPIIALTGNAHGYLAAQSDIALDTSVAREACPLNLAPTASTTAALAVGDALAVCAMRARRFTPDDFARSHPAGTLGQSSKLRVGDLMRTDHRMALVPATVDVRAALEAITAAQCGSALIFEPMNESSNDACGTLRPILCGYVTDGDVRRRLLRCDDAEALLRAPVSDIMTHSPLSFTPRMLAVEALRALQERNVDDAPVVDDDNRAIGLLDVQELLRAGLV